MAKQFGTTAEVRNYGSVMVSSPAVAIYAAASGRFESPRTAGYYWSFSGKRGFCWNCGTDFDPWGRLYAANVQTCNLWKNCQ